MHWELEITTDHLGNVQVAQRNFTLDIPAQKSEAPIVMKIHVLHIHSELTQRVHRLLTLLNFISHHSTQTHQVLGNTACRAHHCLFRCVTPARQARIVKSEETIHSQLFLTLARAHLKVQTLEFRHNENRSMNRQKTKRAEHWIQFTIAWRAYRTA